MGHTAFSCSVFILQFLESVREEWPATVTFGVTAFKQEARAAHCSFKALELLETFCSSPLPVAPLQEAGFVHSPRPDAAPVPTRTRTAGSVPLRRARSGSRPGGGQRDARSARSLPPRPGK